MKKGFTLIELLAVIVILGVLSIITVPMLLNVVEESRKGAFKATCNEIYDAYEKYQIQEEINGESNMDTIFDFNSNRIKTEIIDGIKYEPISKLSLKGEIPKFGTYEIKDGKRELIIDNGKYTCIRNENRNDILDGALADNDITAPVVREIVLSSTTKSIKVIVDGYEEDGLITKYYYQINDGEVVPSDTNVYTFEELNTKEEYEVKVYVENKSGLKSEVKGKKIETKEISGTTYEESENPEEYEYATSKVVKVIYDTQEGLNYYLKTDVEAEVASGIIEECGSDTVPGTCTSINTTTLEANKWYRTELSTTSILFKQEGNIYTIVSDGKNTTGENTYEVVKVSDETPTAPIITGGSESWSQTAMTISVLTDSTGAGGVENYQYCISTLSTECDGTWIDLDSDVTSVEVSTNGTRYIFFKAIGKNGKEGEVSTLQTTMIDTSDPSVSADVSGKTATFTISDNIGVVAYGVNQSETTQPTYTNITSTTNGTITWTASSAGNYVVWVKDAAGRINKSTFTIASSAFCAYNAGQVWNFTYNGTTGADGSIQSFTVPCAGTYKLEVWGAQGGSTQQSGGLGGYAYGTIEFIQGTTLYVVVGGQGVKKTGNGTATGGYNGGGSGGGYTSTDVCASGGGATHIALETGLLKNIGYTKFVTNKKGLIVAGGGGGAGSNIANNHTWTGGSGGGATGGASIDSQNNSLGGNSPAQGGSQTSGGAGSTGGYPGGAGSFGQGGNLLSYYASGGGGGLYGGGAGGNYNGIEGGAGGSGYIGGVIGGSMSNGQRSGHGYARITLVSITQ